MSASKHIKEHAMLGLVGLNAYQATVGNGGRFSSIADAITVRNTLSHTTLETKTATASTTGNYGDREISLGSALASTYTNRLLLAKVASTGCYFLCRCRSTTSIISKHPILTSFTNQDITLYDPMFFNIAIQPGTVLDISAAMTVPDFTSITGTRNTHQIRFTTGSNNTNMFTAATESNGVHFSGLNIANRENAGSQQIIRFNQATARGELCEFSVRDCDIYAGSFDAIYFTDNLYGYIDITGNRIQSRYDVIRATQHKQLNITNNTLHAHSWSPTDDSVAACIAVDTASANVSEVNIRGNTLISESEDEDATGNAALVYPVDIRGQGSNCKVNVQGNKIKALAHDGTAAVVGVGCYTTTATVTPQINIIGNIFDCNRTGGGATIYTIDNINANYVFNRASNLAVAGSVATVGSNTTSYSASLF